MFCVGLINLSKTLPRFQFGVGEGLRRETFNQGVLILMNSWRKRCTCGGYYMKRYVIQAYSFKGEAREDYTYGLHTFECTNELVQWPGAQAHSCY